MFASLGGVRTDRRIMCPRCQAASGRIDRAVADDLRDLAAHIGVVSDNGGPIVGSAFDPETGAEYALREGRVSYRAPRVLRDETVDGVRHLDTVCSTQQQRDAHVHEVKKEGKTYTVNANESGVRPMHFTRPVQILQGFGGDATFRALGHLALNFLTVHFPDVARAPGVENFKKFILGLSNGAYVDFDYSWQTELPPNAFRFGHRVAVGVSNGGMVVAGISLFGVYDVGVQFGVVDRALDRMQVTDIDPLATCPPADMHLYPGVACTLTLRPTPGDEGARHAASRLAKLQQDVADKFWERDVEQLTVAVNVVSELAPEKRANALSTVLRSQDQRILNAATDVARALRARAEQQDGEGIEFLVQVLAGAFEDRNHDLTDRALALLNMIRDDIVDHLLVELNEAPISPPRLRQYLEGPLGHAAAYSALLFVLETVKRRVAAIPDGPDRQ